MARLHTALVQAFEGARSDLSKVVQKARRDIEAIRSGPEAEQWQTRLDAGNREFERVKAELAAAGISDPKDYSRLVAEEAALRREIDALVDSQARAEELDKEAARVLTTYREIRAN